MNYWELAAWIAAAVCLALAARYRHLYRIGKQEIRIYNQLITRIDTAFGHLHLSLLWAPRPGQWEVRDEREHHDGEWVSYPPQLATDPNWTVALQNAVNLKNSRKESAK